MGKSIEYILPCVILLAFLLRIVGIDWDQGYYLHPDERAIVMFTLPLHLPSSVSEFLSQDSPLNPQFFAYGSFPIYLLAVLGYLATHIQQYLGEYSGIYIVGRSMSVLLDTGIVLLVYLVARKIFNKFAGLVAAFFYTIAVFPIQSSHYYTSDVFISFFLLLSFYVLLFYIEHKKLSYLLLSSLFFGIAAASKITSIAFLGVVLVGIFWDSITHLRMLTNKKFISQAFDSIGYFLTFLLFAIVIFCILEPYAIIDSQEFIRQISEQQEMTKDATVFPYTIQYIGKLPYIYELSQIFLWGLGVVVAPICFGGFIYLCYVTFAQRARADKFRDRFLLIFYFLLFFLILGSFAVGWMRYMLLLYPLLCMFGGFFVVQIGLAVKKKLSKNIAIAIGIVFFLGCVLWTVVFMSIYSQDNPRVEASTWIHKNIPSGSVIATEHWDDVLPLYGVGRYSVLSLPVYETDDEYKRGVMQEMLSQADYIVISSQRGYLPIMKLSQCEYSNSYRCYPDTSRYYQSLFTNRLPFKMEREFSNFPKVPILNIPIFDLKADESFSVYDHPKVMIFKKQEGVSGDE